MKTATIDGARFEMGTSGIRVRHSILCLTTPYLVPPDPPPTKMYHRRCPSEHSSPLQRWWCQCVPPTGPNPAHLHKSSWCILPKFVMPPYYPTPRTRLGLQARTDSVTFTSNNGSLSLFLLVSKSIVTRRDCGVISQRGLDKELGFDSRIPFFSSLTRPVQLWDLCGLPHNWYWGALFPEVKRLARGADGWRTFKRLKVRK